MDPAIERLVQDASCRSADGGATENASGEIQACAADNAAFFRLVSQYGLAIAPSAMYPARTTGYGGFDIAIEGTYTGIDANSDYMRRGTRGSLDAGGAPAAENTAVPSVLQQYSLRIRKGFGFGTETALAFGFLPGTSLIAGGADFRLALLEGFRQGALGYAPDFAVAAGVRTVTGSSQLQLTTMGANAVFSKPITIADSGVLTPWLGYQFLWIFGDSGVIDLTPATDALASCGYSGPNQPGFSTGPDQDGEPMCDSGELGDFKNNVVFAPARLERQRLFIGVSYRYEMLFAAMQLMIELVDPSQIQTTAAGTAMLLGVPKSVTFATQLGTQF